MKKFVKKLKGFIVRNKLLSVLLAIFILMFILGLVIIKVFIFPSYGVSKYGNRLQGIDNVKVTDSRFDEVKNSFNSKDGFTISGYRLSGKIIDIYVVADGNISVSDVKSECMKFVSSFSEDELNFYDFQVFVTGFDDPMIGYKNKNSEGLYWNYEGEI